MLSLLIESCTERSIVCVVEDDLSGMTDRYAISEYKKFFTPDEKD